MSNSDIYNRRFDSTRTYNWISNKDLRLKHRVITDLTIKCDCGHSIVFGNKIDRVFCDWCGHYCYKDKQTEFKYKMMEEMNARRIK